MRSTVSFFSSILLATCVLAAAGLALAEPSVLREASGSVEQQRGEPPSAWQLASVGRVIEQGLRVGTGRARIVSGAGQAVLSSDSSLRIFQQEPDFLTGRIYLSGNLKFFSQATHMTAEGKIRLDLSAPTRRVAVIAGVARLAIGTRQVTLRGGQQYNFGTGKITAFAERDPWYDSRFTGEGEANVEAVNGPVDIRDGEGPDAAQGTTVPATGRPVRPVEPLRPGQQLVTGEGAWAEVGFSGGGYLRLQPSSVLSVLSIETVMGQGGKAQREVSLKLLRGSAWNVVAKRQGGYRLSTPTITTAVRGTVFRVDESGLVKVFEGQVALPSQDDTVLTTGKQRDQSGQLQALVTDASDRANQALDAARAEPTRLKLDLSPSLRILALGIQTQPGARLKLELSGPEGALTLPLTGTPQGDFVLQQPGAALPEGRYTLSLSAARPAGTRTLSRPLVIDRSAPQVQFSAQYRQAGRTVQLRGLISDALSGSVVLRAEIGGVVHRRRLSLNPGSASNSAAFNWLLPLPSPDATVQLSVDDEAGNVGYAAP